MLALSVTRKPAPVLELRGAVVERLVGPSAFGNALGESIVASQRPGVDWSQAPDESAAESARLGRSGNAYAAWPDQTDAETARLARSGNPYTDGPDQSDAETARLKRYEGKARAMDNFNGAAAKVWAAEDAQAARDAQAALVGQNARADAYGRQVAAREQQGAQQDDSIVARRALAALGAGGGRGYVNPPADLNLKASTQAAMDSRPALIAAAALGGEFSVTSSDLPPDIASGYAGPAGMMVRDPVGTGIGLAKSVYNNTIGGLAGMAVKGGAYLEAGDMLWSGAVLGIDTREEAMALMQAGRAGEQLILAQPRSSGQTVGMALGDAGFAMAATAGAVNVANLGAFPAVEVNGVLIRPVDVRFGNPGRIAVIGRSMEGVEPYAAALRNAGAEVNIFSKADSTIPAVARNEWDLLSARYGGRIPDSVLPTTKMFEANQSWAQLLNHENYTVINLGNPFRRPPSPFFDMEQMVIFGRSPR